MHTRTKLIEIAQQYFKNPEVNLIYATIDGNFFNESSYNHASNHIKRNPTLGEIETITRADFTEELPLIDWSLDKLQGHCIEQDYTLADWETKEKPELITYIQQMAEQAGVDAEAETQMIAKETEDLRLLVEFCTKKGWDEKEWKDLSLDALKDYVEKHPDPTETIDPYNTKDNASPPLDIDNMQPDQVTTKDATAYKEATGRNAVNHNKVTNGFKEWKKITPDGISRH